MREVEYIILEKSKSDFQKALNQWSHLYELEIIWMELSDHSDGLLFRALIKRWKKL
ncbi:MAG: hypothetical protein ACTSRG_26980 [Candidatus Helarchaeota archaeon]